jgi:uncharacterized protein
MPTLEVPLSALAAFSAIPTVRIRQQEYAKVNELLIAMTMTEQVGGLSALELRFSNVASDLVGGADFAFEDDQILKLGESIAVYAGDRNRPEEIFRGTISALEADFGETTPPELVVLAEDALQAARMQRQTKIYDNLSIDQLAQTIASTLGLNPVITGLSSPIGTWVQFNESPLAFLRRILTRYDADVQVVGNDLQVSGRKDVARGSLTLDLYSQLRKANVLVDLAHQVSDISIKGWNPESGSEVFGQATSGNLGPGRGLRGSDLLPQTRHHHLSHLAVATDDEATAVAEAAYTERARRFVCVQGIADGNPAIRVGTTVNLTGLGRRFSNAYYVVQTCHRFDTQQGYTTEFEAECAYYGGGSR